MCYCLFSAFRHTKTTNRFSFSHIRPQENCLSNFQPHDILHTHLTGTSILHTSTHTILKERHMDITQSIQNPRFTSSTQHLPRQLPPQQMPWPALQRRRIEKLKDDRLHEFERACGESFEWLENYYQGCVYAALQNTDYHETAGGGEAERAFTRSIST